MAEKKGKKKRKFVGLVDEVTGARLYITTKGPNTQEKVRLKKYNKLLRKHTWFEETKKNLGRNVAPSQK